MKNENHASLTYDPDTPRQWILNQNPYNSVLLVKTAAACLYLGILQLSFSSWNVKR